MGRKYRVKQTIRTARENREFCGNQHTLSSPPSITNSKNYSEIDSNFSRSASIKSDIPIKILLLPTILIGIFFKTSSVQITVQSVSLQGNAM